MFVEWSEIPEKHRAYFYDQTEVWKKTRENDTKIIAEKLLSGKEQPHNTNLQIVLISQSSQKGKTMRKQYLQMGPCITVNH